MESSPLLTKSKVFALIIIKVCNEIKSVSRETVLTNQLIRSGTSIGAKVYVMNEVKEFAGTSGVFRACLLHVALPKEGLREADNYLLVQIVDKDGNLGQAATYFTLNK